jgi:protein TonB
MERFITSKLTAEELSVVEHYLETNPFDREALEGLKKSQKLDIQSDLAELNSRIMEKARERTASPRPRSIRPNYWAAAAGVVMLIGLAVVLVYMFQTPAVQELTVDGRQLAAVTETKAENLGAIKSETMEPDSVGSQQSAVSSLEPGTRNPEPGTRNPEPETRNPKPETRNPEPETVVTLETIADSDTLVTTELIEAEPEPEIMEEMVVGGVAVTQHKRTGASKKAMEMQYQAEADAAGIPREDTTASNIFLVVETMPEFPGGEEALNTYLADSLRYPAVAIEMAIQGRVFVTFVVEKDGSISDARILRGIGGGCDEEALRVIQNMPKWNPGRQRGKPVRVQYNLPVKFRLGKE